LHFILQENLFENQLFLSKIRTEKVKDLITPYLFFEKGLFIERIHKQSCNLCDKLIIDAHTEVFFDSENTTLLGDINKLLRIADTGIKSIKIKENNENDFNFPDNIKSEVRKRFIEENRLQIFTKHDLYQNGKAKGETTIELDEESAGTYRLFAVGGLILMALKNGSTFILDELERSLHPYLTKIIIQLFNDVRTNPHNAQLIFTTHDVSLLTSDLFRRDQIWFAEKDEIGISSIYSLGDLKGVRSNIPYHKYYLKGLFGGVPNVNFYDFEFNL